MPSEDIRRGIARHLEDGTLKFNARTGGWVWLGKPVDPRSLATRLIETIDAAENRIVSVLTNMADAEDLAAKLKLQKWVKDVDAKGLDEAPMREFLRLMTGLSPESADPEDRWMYEAYVWVMKQWIWQVKCNILEKEIMHHIVPIFWSRTQGTGKSKNVQRLFSPLAVYARTMDVDRLTAPFMTAILGRSYVVFFEELVGAGKVAMAALKSKVSATVHEDRGMYTDTIQNVRASCSFIATTNDPPPHGLGDESGGRRFGPIACVERPMMGDLERKAALDKLGDSPNALWSCALATDDCPMEQMPKSLFAAYDKYRNSKFRLRKPIESFLDEMFEEEPGHQIAMKEIQEAYLQFLRRTQPGTAKKYTQKDLALFLQENGAAVTFGQNRPLLRNLKFRVDEAGL